MPSRSWDDIAEFLGTDDFADLAEFVTAQGAVIHSVPGILDHPVSPHLAGEFSAAIPDVRFTCAETSVSSLKKDDSATVAGVRYFLAHDPLPDGTGMAVLILAKDFSPPPPPAGGGSVES